jgi:hypothetical protein
MSAARPCSPDEPVMIAWNAYRVTEDYANTKRWATDPRHCDGSLWAAFDRGFNTATTLSGTVDLVALLTDTAEGMNELANGLEEDGGYTATVAEIRAQVAMIVAATKTQAPGDGAQQVKP